MMGININCDARDFCALILDGAKTYETRRTPSLDRYIGSRVGIIRTQKGRAATLVGCADIIGVIIDSAASGCRGKWTLKAHPGPGGMLVGLSQNTASRIKKGACVDGTDYANNGYYYKLANVERCEARVISSRGIVAREI